MSTSKGIYGTLTPLANDDDELLKVIAEAIKSKATRLHLSKKELRELPQEIGLLTSLKILSLAENQLSTLPSKIGQLTNLTKLFVGSNQLSTLPPEIGLLSKLTTLSLSSNQLSRLSPEIGQLTNLTIFYLSSNQLSTLPLEIAQLTNLTKLYLGRNQLLTLPSEIGQLVNLAALSLNGNRLSILPPEIGQLTNLARLSLSNNELGTLPSEIGQLVNLDTLEIRWNRLNLLPAEIWQLTSLSRLDLSSNQLETLPTEIGQLTNLSRLDLSSNQFSSLPAEIGQLTNLTTLELYDNQLSTLPPEIGQLTNLTSLKIGRNPLQTLPAEIWQLSNLTTLDLDTNRLSRLPLEIEQLTNLTTLDLHANQLRTLPPEVMRLTNLTSLDLHANQLSTLSPEIGKLTNLTELDLSGNQFNALPTEIGQLANLKRLKIKDNEVERLLPQIGQLTNLTKLDLDSNQLSTLPPEIGQLTNLTQLYLGGNELKTLPPEIGQLTNLTELDLTGNEFSSLPPEMGQLTKLTKLPLDKNQLSTLPPEIGQLTNLTTLDLAHNQLSTLPPEIGQLTNLTKLLLQKNQLSTLLSEIGQLTNLTKLDLRWNQLCTLPAEIWRLSNLTELDLRDNQLPIPPEILKHTNEPSTIIKYYLKAGTKLNEAKLVLVGQGSVGKTSLVKRLVEGKFDRQEPITEGIDIKAWRVTVNDEQIRLNTWDFGGQEIMHATHQFFLTTRTVYLLVLDARQGVSSNRLDYWLKLIQSFGADSPIIVVINKIDQYQRLLDEHDLRAKYPTIKAFVNTSCETGEGIAELERQITAVVDHLEHVRDLIPFDWLKIRIELESMGKNDISYNEYVSLCQANKIHNEQEQRALIRLLHDLGVVLNFADDPKLRETIVLSPEWITDAVYRVINAKPLQNQGVLDIAQLAKILPPYIYPKERYLLILEMMRRFERCFDLEGYVGEKFLIPDLLPVEEPPIGFWPHDSLDFEYHYNFLPSSIISRFMVHTHNLILGDYYWRTGVALVKDKNKALVKAIPQDKKISISVIGKPEDRRKFLTDIRSKFEQVHQTISNLEAVEQVVYEKVPIPYKLLKKLHERGIRHHCFVRNNDAVVANVEELLDRVKWQRRKQQDTQIERLLEELRQRLHPQLFYDSALSLGKEHYKVGACSLARQALAVTHQALRALQRIGSDLKLARESAELYPMLVHCCVAEENYVRAFEYAAVHKGQTLVNQLIETGFDIEAMSNQKGFARKLKRVRKLHKKIENSWKATPTDTSRENLRGEQYKLLQEESTQWQKMEHQYPLLTAILTVPTLSRKQVCELAKAFDAVLVEYYHHAGGWGTFVVTAHQIRYIPLPDLNNQLLTRVIEWQNKVDLPAGGRPKRDQRLTEVYDAAIAPLGLKDERVIIAFFEGLHPQLLLAAYNQATNRHLRQEYTLSFVPSLTILHVFKQEQKQRALSQETLYQLLGAAYLDLPENYLPNFLYDAITS